MNAHASTAGSTAEGWIIGLVGSAGGLEAVSEILAHLPPDLDAAVIVLIHQQPDRVSHLVELLERRSVLPVVVAEDGTALEPGRVVVIPPGRHLLVTRDLRTSLIVSGDAPPSRPSADLLLATLATAAGRRAIAVVLSGGGHDGATGATAVHDLGGTVLASDEASSTMFSMPNATIERGDVIDQVLPLERVATALGELARGGTRRPDGG